MDYEEPVIMDVDDYKNNESKEFSHQMLVMSVMRKAIEASAKEMRQGYYNEKVDRHGNTIRNYIEDTRKTFKECVETAIMIMICDFDKDATDNIKKHKDRLKVIKEDLFKLELKDWTSVGRDVLKERLSKGIFFRDGYLNTNLPYYQEYLEESVEVYREIFKELTLLTKRLYFYEVEDLEA